MIVEVLVILISLLRTQTLLTSFLVLMCFPLSLALISFFENFIGWNWCFLINKSQLCITLRNESIARASAYNPVRLAFSFSLCPSFIHLNNANSGTASVCTPVLQNGSSFISFTLSGFCTRGWDNEIRPCNSAKHSNIFFRSWWILNYF